MDLRRFGIALPPLCSIMSEFLSALSLGEIDMDVLLVDCTNSKASVYSLSSCTNVMRRFACSGNKLGFRKRCNSRAVSGMQNKVDI